MLVGLVPRVSVPSGTVHPGNEVTPYTDWPQRPRLVPLPAIFPSSDCRRSDGSSASSYQAAAMPSREVGHGTIDTERGIIP